MSTFEATRVLHSSAQRYVYLRGGPAYNTQPCVAILRHPDLVHEVFVLAPNDHPWITTEAGWYCTLPVHDINDKMFLYFIGEVPL